MGAERPAAQARNQRLIDRGPMSAAATSATSLVSRCAVCKIDRKGRFVFLDDETEKLLGLSQVELFAKPFADFLDPADHEVINEMTSQFNRYESFYDAAPVTVINSHGKRIRATVVVSLNFAAGNPVNYEIIINTVSAPKLPESKPVAEDGSRRFLRSLRDLQPPSESPAAATAIVEALHNYIRSQSVGLYDASEETPRMIASIGEAPPDPAEFEGLDSQCYTTVLEISGEEEYLLKVRFDDSVIDDELASARERAELAALLVAQLLSPRESREREFVAADTFSLVDLLEKMQVAAALFGSEGHLVDDNERMRHLLPSGAVSCLDDFSKELVTSGSTDARANIRTYIEASDSATAPPNLELAVCLPSGRPARLTIFRLAPGSEDRSAYCTLSSEGVGAGSMEREPLPIGREFIQGAIEKLRASISAGLSVSRKIDHEHRSELTRDGGFYLECLANHLLKIQGVADKLASTASFVAESEKPALTDLKLLVDQILPEIQSAYPQVRLSLNKSSLPKIEAEQRKLRRVIKEILSHLVAHATGAKAGISVGATINAKECHIRIKCDGAAIPRSHLENAFDNPGLGVTRELVASMGGSLKLAKSTGKGSVLTVTLPTRKV
ncbi:MAG: PAS domain S-box protein [bacterium]|nr:PAS domain S-box protein [bacterium]